MAVSDIKPENAVILTSGRDKGVVKIIDWGFAKEVEEQTHGLRRAHTNAKGTPGYMAPEVPTCTIAATGASLLLLNISRSSCSLPLGVVAVTTRMQSVTLKSVCLQANCSSPQWTGEYNSLVDVYSLGVTLTAFISRQTKDGPLSHLDSTRMTDDCRDLITHMTNRNPAARYDIEQVANHPWLKGAMQRQMDKHGYHRHGMTLVDGRLQHQKGRSS